MLSLIDSILVENSPTFVVHMAETDSESRESELIRRVLEGDAVALEEFLLRNYGFLEAYIQRRIPPGKRGLVRSEDIIQEVYLKIFRNAQSYRPEGRAQLYSWLQTVARNTLFDALRKHRREDVLVEADITPGERDSEEIQNLIVNLAIDQNPRVSQDLRRQELHQAFRVALGSLTDDYRRVIELLYIEQLSIEAVAQQLGKSVDAVRGIRMRARRQLRETLLRLSRFV